MQSRYYDELLRYFPAYGAGSVRLPGIKREFSATGTDACEAHHVFGGRMGRWDRVWNLVAVARPTHEWVERFKTDGRVIAIKRKLDLGEFDNEEATECLGFNPIGWLCSHECVHPFAEAIRLELACRYHEL